MNIEYFKLLADQKVFSVLNRTRRYLLPCITDYGQDFLKPLEGLSHFAVAVDDMENPFERYELGVVVNVERSKTMDFVQKLSVIRKLDPYVRDYLYGELLYDKLHVIVIKTPEQYQYAYDKFIEGKYSQMYTSKEVWRLFDPSKKKDVIMREYTLHTQMKLIKHEDERMRFENELNEGYDTEMIILRDDSELDYLPRPEMEVLNYKDLHNDDEVYLSTYFQKKYQSLLV